MLLAFDIGNTNIVPGIFKGDKLVATWRLATDIHRMPDEYSVMLLNLLDRSQISPQEITEAVMSSVVPPLTPTFEELCERHFGIKPLVVGSGIKTGIRICTDNPREVGADRVVDALAAYRLYGGPVIVIDLGTATTFDAVSKEGDLLGTAIAPGLRIAAESLYEKTAQLPRIELVRPKQAIGKNTITAMQSGLIFGYIGLMEGIVKRIRRELGGSAKVVATGGLANFMAKENPIIDVVEPDLTLLGLYFIHELNRSQPGQSKARKSKPGRNPC